MLCNKLEKFPEILNKKMKNCSRLYAHLDVF